MAGWDAPWHWIVIAIVVVALFGYKRLPDASRSLGRSLRIFKREINGLADDVQRSGAADQDGTPKALPAAEAGRSRPRPTRAA